MKKNIIPTIALIIMSITACTSQSLQQRAAAAKAAADKALKDSKGTGTKPLSNDEVIKGLKDALTVGTNNSTGIASKADGYYKNPKLFIPFPPEAKQVKDKMDALGMKPQTDKFVMTLNRAAEEAAKNAAPVFINAVKGMSIGDGFGILKGADNAATQYLKDKTTAELKQKFTPIVKAAIDKVEVTKYWNPIITKYNKIPMVQKQNPDLTAYVTEKAMAGLFMLLAEEELKIRKDPMARVNDILKRVFGSL
ncbi:MAG: DUF4197 domain-containing protein [Bacteroidota bacterium]|nr:DUF4197 domain-containing protein [Bacteroidota bacterium]